MADIKQAVKWIDEGILVRRKGWQTTRNLDIVLGRIGPKAQVIYSFSATRRNLRSVRHMKIDDLLADDWEIAE